MRNMTILAIKFVACTIAFAIGLDLFFDATLLDIVTFSLFVTVVSYVLGDRIILPQLGNAAALVTDFLLTYLSVWIFGTFLLDGYLQIAWGSIISAILVAAVELFVHVFLLGQVLNRRVEEKRQPRFNGSFAYEFAEEQDIADYDQKKPE